MLHLAEYVQADGGWVEVVGVARIVASLVPGREAINSKLRTKSDILGLAPMKSDGGTT